MVMYEVGRFINLAIFSELSKAVIPRTKFWEPRHFNLLRDCVAAHPCAARTPRKFFEVSYSLFLDPATARRVTSALT